MPIVTTRTVILKTYPYSETSKILRLMTREHGPLSAIAKGARRPGSKFGGLIESFAEGDATVYLKENRDLHTLSDFDLITDRQRLGVDLERFTGASVICELIMRLAPGHRDDRLYRLLTAGLDALVAADAEEVGSISLRVIWSLVSTLGFAPDLSVCRVCGRSMEEAEEGRFDLPAGGLRCTRCPPSPPAADDDRGASEGVLLREEELASLRSLARPGESPNGHRDIRVSRRQRRLLVDFIRYHLTEGLNLRSLRFLLEGTTEEREGRAGDAGS